MLNREFKRKYWYPISVDIEIRLRKFRRFTDRVYRKIWPFIFASIIVLALIWGTLQVKHDYDLIQNVANIDTPFSDYYTSWNTDGKPGKEPTK